MPDELRPRVLQAVQAHRLLTPGDRVVVAVSGGADSIALLHLLRGLAPSWRLSLHVAHLDHAIRAESVEDAGFVSALANRWGLAAMVERRDVPATCAKHGWSLEEGARRIRYEFLLEAARRYSATRLALAHTADDQAETVLMRLLRGAGLLGLGAMPWQRQLDGIWVIRPLLGVWRQEVLVCLEQASLAHREDATNRDVERVRNRIRHELLPLLERDYNPQIKTLLTQLADQSQWDYAYLAQAAARQWRRMAKPLPEGGVRIAIAAFAHQPIAVQRQLMRQVIQQLKGDLRAFEFRHWREIERLFAGQPVGTIAHLPGGIRLQRTKDFVHARQTCVNRTTRGIL